MSLNSFSIISDHSLLDDQDFKMMEKAIRIARKGLKTGDWPIGAVITANGKIIGQGNNSNYSSNTKLAHAEIKAIQDATPEIIEAHKRGEDICLYVTYAPCPMCLGACLLNHIGKIVCGPDLDDSSALDMIEHLPMRFHQKKYHTTIVKDVLKEECEKLFQESEYFSRKIEYNIQQYKK